MRDHPIIEQIERTGYPNRGGMFMGETTEMIINGLICQYCTCLIDGEEPGYPRTCEDCEEE